ncbi:MAG TPA: ATP-binding protein [Solirubrobacteraceae bacterium]|jgi:DNA replication protein DnaC|nr:ATP-binding protein [Solirubrobacteraceae bacterium]
MSGDVLILPQPYKPGACPLNLCDGSGFIVDEATNTASDCRCRAVQIAKRRTRRLEARIPNRYRDVSFDQLGGSGLVAFPEHIQIVRRFATRIEQNLDAGRGVWIMGDIGTGKTTLAMLISKAALAAGRTVAIYSLPRLLNLIREAIEDDDGVVGFLDRLATVDLLHLDDVGAENRTDWALEQLYSIINTRYEEERSIIVTTNLKPDELAEQIGPRTVSRLTEMCPDQLPLYGEDRRKELPFSHPGASASANPA